ncbi:MULTISPECIES: MBL fold metallo-hydrolase [unclassified Microbacterium]|uniref:MBL fold metallo-hydrolase n=1 Tax=unclassified Microbacterium TaxID=2609290 RepID=UPI001AD4E57E|nr:MULTISPECIES: MBL fold metallo-hydrolase [unclassified Microbacterium]MBN9158418.1 MBL fold metallo-hydrolase [Microbacterium sp.]
MVTDTIDPRFPHPPGTDGDVVLWWLGQAGFAIRHGDTLLFIDPYLSDVLAGKYRGKVFPHTRMQEPPVNPSDVAGLDAVLCTHGHTDHMDLGAIPYLQSSSDPLFVVPRSEALKAVSRGIPASRLVGLDAQESFATPGYRITAVPAAHEEIVVDGHGQNLFLGYVIEIGGVRIYHSGDCAPYAGQQELIAKLGVDLALLPVNGRDAHRNGNGVPGNLTLDEAVALTRAAGIPALVCHHWGMFEFNTADPEELRSRLADVDDVRWRVPVLGAPFTVSEMIR